MRPGLEQEQEQEQGIACDYARFPREFASYRWFKPLLVALLAIVFYVAMTLALVFVASAWAGDFDYLDTVSEGYDDMDVYTGPGALLELGEIALMLPALALAALVVRDRPFSSYSTSRGGWSWKAFFCCLAVAAAVMAVDAVVELALFPGAGGDGVVRFTAAGVALCVVLIPLQCAAEEYIFRGFILQTVGAWTGLPALAIAASAAAFAAGHPYNLYGVVAIFLNGVVWGFVAWKTRGLEATLALHVVNNYLAFLTEGFGLSAATSEVTAVELVAAVVIDVVYAAAVIALGKRFGWFTPVGGASAGTGDTRGAAPSTAIPATTDARCAKGTTDGRRL